MLRRGHMLRLISAVRTGVVNGCLSTIMVGQCVPVTNIVCVLPEVGDWAWSDRCCDSVVDMLLQQYAPAADWLKKHLVAQGAVNHMEGGWQGWMECCRHPTQQLPESWLLCAHGCMRLNVRSPRCGARC